jgi:YaaC-like Protein
MWLGWTCDQMALIDSEYIGSFQEGLNLRSENPLEEVWSRLGLYGSEDYLRENLTDVKDKEASAAYIAVRTRQAIELRAATREATLLTAPLSLYYSVLNLTRASLAIRDDVLDSKKHGLFFYSDPDILQCHAKITGGTFSEYLKIAGSSPKNGVRISLDDCLSRIIETGNDYRIVAGQSPYVCPVRIQAYRSGKMLLHFLDCGETEDFRSQWQNHYPSLVTSCHLEPTGCILRINDDIKPTSFEDVRSLCSKLLETNLISSDPTWFLVRKSDPELFWPRPAYYFAALFILGSIVRYQPELMYQITSTHSKWGWFFRRFIAAAERFYPHLMFNWIHNAIYFFD